MRGKVSGSERTAVLNTGHEPMSRATSPSAGKENTITIHKNLFYKLRWSLGGHFLHYFPSISCYSVSIWRPLKIVHIKKKKDVAWTSKRKPIIHIVKGCKLLYSPSAHMQQTSANSGYMRVRDTSKMLLNSKGKIKSTYFLHSLVGP